jgi:hypothetical protein
MPFILQKATIDCFEEYLALRKNDSGKSPICSLQGAPGVGKTRFICEFASRMHKAGRYYPVMITFNSYMPIERSELTEPVTALILRIIAV